MPGASASPEELQWVGGASVRWEELQRCGRSFSGVCVGGGGSAGWEEVS